VKVVRVDMESTKIDFTLVEEKGEPAPSGQKKKKDEGKKKSSVW